LAYKADNRKKNNEKGGQPESCPRKPGGRLFRLLYALGAGLGIWGVINLLEGYGNDNRATRS